ncbi:MAG: class I tRNA ligase family protein, partial [Alistipes sp.]|nr:class I tRNA ligase family protein [Alistipes sp.]
KLGRKMSKQLGNSPDPLDLIAKYGADGMRVAMMLSSSAGNDVMFDEALCEQGRNFGNKIWNAYRLINGWEVDENMSQTKNNAISIMWFEHTLSKAIAEIDEMFASYRISEAFMRIYKLFWDEFSGWYLELVKPAYQTPIDRETMDATRRFFDLLMRLIHPFMPFVTEEIWQDLEPRKAGESIMYAPMPKATAVDENLLMRFDLVKEIISNVRNIRKQHNIPQRKTLTLNFILDENFPAELADVVVKMCNLENVAAVEKKNPAAESFMVKTTQYFIPMEDSIDVEAELKKLSDELTYLEGFLASVMKKLSNERFVQSAPEKVVANERAKQADAEAKIAAIKERMEALK